MGKLVCLILLPDCQRQRLVRDTIERIRHLKSEIRAAGGQRTGGEASGRGIHGEISRNCAGDNRPHVGLLTSDGSESGSI